MHRELIELTSQAIDACTTPTQAHTLSELLFALQQAADIKHNALLAQKMGNPARQHEREQELAQHLLETERNAS